MGIGERAAALLHGFGDRFGPFPLIAVNKLLRPLGLAMVRARALELVYRHDYGRGGYDKYRRIQAFHNKRKLDHVHADEATLALVADHIRAAGRAVRGICHGARNGWEVRALKEMLGCEVIGTDISESAEGLPGMVRHDFHEPREEWRGGFSFVYTNSLDQAFDPARALAAWTDQLAPGGAVYVEHNACHVPASAGAMDPFGAHPLAMPYLIFEWGRGRFRLDDILRRDRVAEKDKRQVWIFVIVPEAAGAGEVA
jgi:hypothetical protein